MKSLHALFLGTSFPTQISLTHNSASTWFILYLSCIYFIYIQKYGSKCTIFDLNRGKRIILCHHTMTQLPAKLLLLRSFCKLFCSVGCLMKHIKPVETMKIEATTTPITVKAMKGLWLTDHLSLMLFIHG